MSTTAADEAGRAIAAWLAPYIADALGLERGGSAVEGDAGEVVLTGAQFDDASCRELVRGLGSKVLANARSFFAALAEKQQLGSLEAARMAGVSSPRNLPSVLTTPIKRRAKALGLPQPWRVGSDHEDRTVWFALDGVSERLVKAIDDELASRSASTRS